MTGLIRVSHLYSRRLSPTRKEEVSQVLMLGNYTGCLLITMVIINLCFDDIII